jgi:hypothetical protein
MRSAESKMAEFAVAGVAVADFDVAGFDARGVGMAEEVAPRVAGSEFVQPGGGATCTMLPHFGQDRICPMAAGSMTFSRALQVVQATRNGFTASFSAEWSVERSFPTPAGACHPAWQRRPGW